MEQILDILEGLEESCFEAGQEVLRQGERKNQLWVLLEGKVEIIKNGQLICEVSDKGAVFGELSVMLKTFHNAAVRTKTDCKFYRIDKASTWFEENPSACLHLAKVLARRLALLDSYFAELKRDFSDMSSKVEEPSPMQSERSHLITEFLKKAEKGIEERAAGGDEAAG